MPFTRHRRRAHLLRGPQELLAHSAASAKRGERSLAKLEPRNLKHFADTIIQWQKQHGRHDLPWQQTRDPYTRWVSEVMLQQTQVAHVIPYYLRFMALFPTVTALADAPIEEVLKVWAGLGYYARARHLYRAAQWVCLHHQGVVPTDPALLLQLPGIGRSTAAAIATFCGEPPHAILDGNVKRLLSRVFAIAGSPSSSAVQRQLWELAESLLPIQQGAAYIQGLMDLGATLCTARRPLCNACPLQRTCQANQLGQQAHFPTARSRPKLAQKFTRMLLLQTPEGKFLVEKRPSSGLWGGLWCFPQLDPVQDPVQQSQEKWGLFTRRGDQLATLRHTFTHFHLDIEPHLLHVDLVRSAPVPCTDAFNWFTLQQLQSEATPVAVRKLVRQLQKHPACALSSGESPMNSTFSLSLGNL